MRLITFLLLLAFPISLSAQGLITNPLVFEREQITILPTPAPETAPTPATKSDTAEKEMPPVAARMPVTLNVEVRPEDALKLDYIHALTTLNDTNGVMLAFGAPTIAPLPMFRVQQATDVLFVDDTGLILQIYPGHIPMDVTREIYADKPIKALLYVKAGLVAARDIRPKDRVQSRVFTPPPPILQ